MSNQFQIEAGVKSDVGRKRPHNEDSIYPSEDQVPPGTIDVATSGVLFIVADGLGGYAAGEVASGIAVETLTSQVRNAAPDIKTAGHVLRAGIQEASSRIFKRALEDVNKTHMASTCVAALLVDGIAFIANVGDSRAYLLRGGKLLQVSNDHSLVAEQVRRHMLTPDQARAAQQRNVITRCLGHTEEVEVDVFPCQLFPGDVLLLCSDGLHGQVTDQQLETTLNSLPPRQAVAKLIENANAAGGPDNISAVVVRVLSVPQPPASVGGTLDFHDATTAPRLATVPAGGEDSSESPTIPLQAINPEIKAAMEAMAAQSHVTPPPTAAHMPATPPRSPVRYPDQEQTAPLPASVEKARLSQQEYRTNPGLLPPSLLAGSAVSATQYPSGEAPQPLSASIPPTPPVSMSSANSTALSGEPEMARQNDPDTLPAAAFPQPSSTTGPQRIIPFPGNWVGEGSAVGKRLGPYTLLRRIGGGNTGEVYEAQKEVPDKLFAVKILRQDPTQDEAFLTRFTREAKLVAKLDHRNVVRLTGVYVKGNLLYMVMPLVRGKSLQARLDRLGSLPHSPEETGSYIRQIVQALQYAHENEVIHGDLKPANILIRDDGLLQVSDFGLVRAIQGETGTTNHMASSFYMAPELIRGKGEKRSDIYSLGALVYQLLTGRPPFMGEEVLMQHLSNLPPALHDLNPGISADLEKVVLRALEKRPENRYKTPREFAEAYHLAIGRRL